MAWPGLVVIGQVKKVYDGWKYPEDWVVESFSQEGPKILKRGDYYYMVLAEGGTAGPPTGHMIVAARAKTLEGPWDGRTWERFGTSMEVSGYHHNVAYDFLSLRPALYGCR
jgi:beta-xylosidase